MNNLDNKTESEKGKIFVVSAPSGAGKTTLCHALLKRFPEISYSISHTTRKPRKNERDGKDYYFITVKEFETKIKSDYWVEWAKVHDNYYGTSLKHIEKQICQGFNVLLEIDVKGARQIKKIYPDAVTIFIMPPNAEVLEQRLKNRATDSDEIINIRLENAKTEMEQKHFYDYVVINDEIDAACERFCEIVKKTL